jgi:subtilisin family serine protease
LSRPRAPSLRASCATHASRAARRVRAALPAVVAALLAAARVAAQPTATPLPASLAGQVRAAQAEKAGWGPAQRKVGAALHAFVWPRAHAQRLDASPLVTPWRHGTVLHVYITVTSTAATDLRRLEDAGATIEILNPELRMMQAWVDEGAVPRVAALPFVRAIRPVHPAGHRAGAVTSLGDAAARADLVRAMGYEGAGITVGVISDGIDSVPASQVSGDVGTVTVPADGRCTRGRGHEGTAILEIVHDLAPGAVELFSGGLDGRLAFVNAVRCLTAAGAHVIIDDLVYFDEPYFEDGILAGAVRAAVLSGVSYHSAAGNDALAHVADGFRPAGDDFHDFDPGPGVDTITGFRLPAGQTAFCFLQWNDPFGASSNDYDLFVVDDPGGTVRAAGTSAQSGTQDPYEEVGVTNPTASTLQLGLAIKKVAGLDRTLKILCTPADIALEHRTALGSIFGHAAIEEAIAVGAIDVHDPGLNDVESFSSGGPAVIHFPSFRQRAKPDLVAFDGVATTAPGFADFHGTSAAAPHAAAVAALLLSKNPFLAPADIQGILTATAVDVGPPGRDHLAGAGRLDALAALDATPMPCPGGCVDGDACSEDICRVSVCIHPPVRCDDGFACTVDACDHGLGCVFQPPPGAAGIDCVLAVARGDQACAGIGLPRQLRRQIERGTRLVQRVVTDPPPPQRQSRVLARARRCYRNAARMLRAAIRHQRLPADCGAVLAKGLDETLARLPRPR